ncbi:MAG TPA: hypothetical protein VIP11_05170 [Gemmatimonadaceae bacterium]
MRAFDRRAEWYEKSFRALSEASSLFQDFRAALRRYPDDRTALDGVSDQFAAAAKETRAVLDASVLFASEQTTGAIHEAADAIVSLADPFNAATVARTDADLAAIIQALHRAMELLVDEHRAHLGMKRFDHDSIR